MGPLDTILVDTDGIHLHRAFLDVAFFLPFKYDFFPATSNSFNLGTLFDAAAATCTVFGVPSAGGVLVSLFMPVNHYEWWIKIQAYVDTSPDNLVALPSMPSSYWYPYSS